MHTLLRLNLFGCLLAFLMSTMAFAQSQLTEINFPVEKFTLDNGLTVLVQKDNTVPLISYYTWFKVGSKDEDDGYTGIAHLFEHMMFKGAQRHSGEDFTRLLRENGGNFNAFTTRDYTAYFLNLPSSKLDLAMDLESDRMVNLKLSNEMMKSERDVVKEERRFRYDNNVLGTLFEAIFESAFQKHPYRWPVIGWWQDLDRISVEKAMEFYKEYYAPNNAVICIVGDVEIDNVKKLINKYYGGIPSSKINKKVYPTEPDRKTELTKELEKDSQSDYVSLTYTIPKAGSPENYVFEILGKILGQGNSSRLYRRLVYDSQVATSVSVHLFGLQEVDLFQIVYSLKPEKDADKIQKMKAVASKIIDGELWLARNKLYTERELQKAKNNLVMEMVESLKTFNGRARSLAANEVLFGSYQKVFTDIENYTKVSPEDIKSVSEKFLNSNQRSVLNLHPKRDQK